MEPVTLQTAADLTENFDLSTMTTTKPAALAVRAAAAAVLHTSAGSCDTAVTGDLRCFHVLQVSQK